MFGQGIGHVGWAGRRGEGGQRLVTWTKTITGGKGWEATGQQQRSSGHFPFTANMQIVRLANRRLFAVTETRKNATPKSLCLAKAGRMEWGWFARNTRREGEMRGDEFYGILREAWRRKDGLQQWEGKAAAQHCCGLCGKDGQGVNGRAPNNPIKSH